jgi:YggT family protein
MHSVASILIIALWLFIIAILIRVAFSWVAPNASNPALRFAVTLTEPVLGPVRHRLPPVSGMDLSPLVVMLVCYFLIDALGFVG